MNLSLTSVIGWVGGLVGGWSGALGERVGKLINRPGASLVDGAKVIGPDDALQLSAVWRCVELLSSTIATLPFFVYLTGADGQRSLARTELLYQILHDSPNSRMTPTEFWTAMILNLLLRGNAYARIERLENGQAFALWPMPSDQVESELLKDGTQVYYYRIGNDLAVLSAENVLHIKGMGNGTIGLSRLDYMRATTSEATNAQIVANKLFANQGKPSGILMIDRVLDKKQRDAIKANFIEMAEGGTSRLHVLEANMKYEQINLTPEQQQLLQTRQFGVEEICRWFGVPPVLVGHANVTAWGSGIEQLIEGFYKLVIRPLLVNVEQAITKRVATPAQRSRLTVEASLDALLRASLKDRIEIYAKAVQNGLKTRNECRQLENDPPKPGADELTAQTNLAPLHMLGKLTKPGVSNAAQETATAQ